LPYVKDEETRPIAVEKVELTISADKRWVEAGKQVTFTGKLTKDGVGWGGRTVYIQVYLEGAEPPMWSNVASGTTGADGSYTITWTAEWERYGDILPCTDRRVRAFADAEVAVYSPEIKVAIAYPTRISIEAPGSVKPGEPFNILGKLEYEESPGVWKGLPDKTVVVYYDNTWLGETTTVSDGTYGLRVTIATPGKYTLKAVFEGAEIPAYAPSWAYFTPPEWPDWVRMLLDVLAAGSPVLIVGGLIAYDALTRRPLSFK